MTNKHYEKGQGVASNIPPDVPDPFVAAFRDDVKALKVAIPYCGVNAQDNMGMTLLHHGVLGYAFDAVEFLMTQTGVDPTIIDTFDRTASDLLFEVNGRSERAMQMSARLQPSYYPDREPDQPDLTVLKGAKTDPGRNTDRSHLTFIPGGRLPRFPGPGGS